MKINFRSIHFRLTFWYVLVLAFILLAFSILVYFSLAHSLNRDIDITVQAQAEWIVGLIGSTDNEIEFVDFDELTDELTQNSTGSKKNLYIQIRQGTGNVIYHSDQLDHDLISSKESIQRAVQNKSTIETIIDPSIGRVRLVTMPVKDEEIIYLVQVGADFKGVHSVIRRLLSILIGSGVIALMAAIFGGRFLMQKAMKPVDEITKTARKIEAENLNQRLVVPPTGDELSQLASTLNEMIDRLEHSFRQIRQFTADASHELRTPLTVMRGQVEVTLRKERPIEEYRQVLESNLEEAEWMSKIVENLLTLSRADAGEITLEAKSVSLGQLLEDAYEECKILAEIKNIQVFLDKIQKVEVIGDELRLRQLLWNLIDNAVKYTLAGGKIHLSLETDGVFAKLKVEDTGIGISQEDLPRIFDRFFRVDKARSREMSGSGLGLSIVRWIVNAHKGHIEVVSRLGEGSCFTVLLPLDSKQD